MTSSNERKYQRLLRWYPRWWRETNGQVVLTTLLDVDDARGATGPTASEAWSLRLAGLRTRCRLPVTVRKGLVEQADRSRHPWMRSISAIGAASVVTIAVGGWAFGHDQEGQVSGAGGGRTLDALLQDTSDYQRLILADGVVTTAEYENALLDWRDCVSAAGANPSDIYPIGENDLTFDYEITAATDDARVEREGVAETCLPEYFREVGVWWVEQDPQPLPLTLLAPR